ncbi:Ferredoxin [Azospirillaceae bacterium]
MSNEELYYRIHLFACTNVRPEDHPRGSCAGQGKVGEIVRNYLKVRVKELGLEKVRINGSGCLDRCEQGPLLVIYPEGAWYRFDSIEDAEEILQTVLVKGQKIERLLVKPDAQ